MQATSRFVRGTALVAVGAIVALSAACGTDADVAGGDSATATWSCGDDCSWESGASTRGAEGAELADAAVPASGGAGERPATVDRDAAPVEDLRVTAGSVDDNEAWEDYLLYRQAFDARSPRPPVRDIPVEGRQVIQVRDADGHPVLGARIAVEEASGATVAELATYADGRALFHAPTGAVDPDSQRRAEFTAVVTPPGGAEPVRHRLDPELRSHEVVVGTTTPTAPVRLDVALLLDATGSMGDEIDRLKANVVSVAEQVAAHPSAPDVRFALTVYRDVGDDFVTRSFGFTSDVEAFTAALREVQADGGGDVPEALEEGLAEVVTGQEWRDDAVQLVFLVADAPPHLREGVGYDQTLRAATARGIKVFPIASSGAAHDAGAEYVFRQIAQITMARFVFLTYGADGASPGEHTDHEVEPGSYDVLALDELVVALVEEELGALAR